MNTLSESSLSRKSGTHSAGNTLACVFVISTLIAFYIEGPFVVRIANQFALTPFDILMPILFILWVWYASTHKLKFSKSFILILSVFLIFCALIALGFFRSPQPVRGFTEFLLMMRNLLLFLMIGSLIREIRDMESLNRSIFYLGVFFAILALFIYRLTLAEFQHFAISADTEFQSAFYWMNPGDLRRVSGFAGDPVRYAAISIIPLFCGLSLKRIKPWAKYLGILIITVSLFLTLTRGFYVAFLLGTLAILLLHRRTLSHLRYLKPLIMITPVIILVGVLPLIMSKSPLSVIQARFERYTEDPRHRAWGTAMSSLSNPIIGDGLRAHEERLIGLEGISIWLDNTYLLVIIETGFLGLSVFLFLLALIIIKGLFYNLPEEILPFTHALTTFTIMQIFYSYSYTPYLWLMASVISGSEARLAMENRKNN